MKKWSSLMAATGFLWHVLFSIFGSLVGAWQHAHWEDPSWQNGLQGRILKSLHAHMNTMSLCMVLMALTASQLAVYLKTKTIGWIFSWVWVAIALFALGMVGQSFQTTPATWATLISALGGAGYMAGVGFWGCVLLYHGLSGHRKNSL